MSYPFLDPTTEDRLLDEVATRRRRMAALRGSITPRVASLAAAYADAYPWMDASAVSSFVQAGIPPDAPQVQSIAELAAVQAAEEGQFSESAEDVPDAWYETLVNTMFGWAKPVVRTGMTILATPWEELSALLSSAGVALFDRTRAGKHGLLSDIGGTLSALASELSDPGALLSDFWDNYTNKAARSTGLLALGDLLAGREVDLGDGWLPGGEIARERERAKWRLTLDGEFVTPGRIFARTFTEPGTTAYQIASGLTDAAGAIFADPTGLALKALSGAAKATRTFQATGVIQGLRKTVAPEIAVNHYLTSGVGRRLVRWLSETDDIDDIWQAIGRANIGLARRLAETRNPDEVFRILSDSLGTVIRERPTAGFMGRTVGRTLAGEYGALFGGGAAVRRAADSTRIGFLHRAGRLLDDMPGSSVNVHDVDDAAVTLDRWMRNAGLGNDTRKKVIGELAHAEPGDLFEVTKKAVSAVEELLVKEAGVRPTEAKRLTRMFEDLGDDLHTFDVDDLGNHVDVLAPLRVNVGGETVDLRPMPGMISELVNDVIPLPDPRAIRSAVPIISPLKKVYESGLWKGSVDALDAAMSFVWKPLQLLRVAYPVRVIAEEQIRMAAAGYDSMFRHPISAMAWVMALKPDSKLAKWLVSKVDDAAGSTTLLGEVWDDVVEFKSALARGAAGWAGLPSEVLTGQFVRARQGDVGFYRGWATELAHQANDPVMRRVAGGLTAGDLRSIGKAAGDDVASTFDDLVEWFWSGSGKSFREKLGRIEGREALLTNKEAAARYLQQNYVDRLRRFTGGNPDLVELVASGRLEVGKTKVNLRGFRNESRLAKILEDSYSSAAPNYVKMEVALSGMSSGQRTLNRMNRATDIMFEHLMTRPTNELSRSPTFRQAYWKRVEELIGFADRPTQEAIIKAARDAGVGDDVLKRMASRMLKGEGTKLTARRVEVVDDLTRLGGMSREEFLSTGEVLYRGTTRQHVAGKTSRSYFTDDPEVASRFAMGGFPERSLSEYLGDADLAELVADDVAPLFRGGSTIQVAIDDVDDAGNLIYRTVSSPDELVSMIRASSARFADEVTIRQIRPDRSPNVVRTKVYGKTLDLSGDLGEVLASNPGLREALEADGLLRQVKKGMQYRVVDPETGKLVYRRASRDIWVLEGWQSHERAFDNVADWMRSHGFGKARVPDDPFISGPTSIIALDEFVDLPGRPFNVESLVGRTEIEVPDLKAGMEYVDALAKGFALSETKKLLYDLTKRSQVFDALRLIFPFGEAWKEILTTWTRLVRQNPQIVRRFQQGLHGARTPSVLGRPDTQTDSGQGFFSPDPQTGEEVFYYPAGWLGKLLGLQQESGAGLRLPARAAGLNIVATSVLPGFGPVVQIPASKLIPDTPKWDDLREILLPFGEQSGLVEAFTPAWLDKLRTAFEDPETHRLFGNTVIDVMRALNAKGGYGPGEAERLYQDAVPRARVLYLVRALAQFVAPTGPSFGWTTTDLEGNVVPVKLLADDLRRLTEQYGGDRTAAFREWVKRYGTDNVLAVIGKSTAIVERPVTEKGDAWLRAHQDLEKRFPLTVGYFAPEPAVGEFDYTAYLRQFKTGARRALTPKEQLAIANDFLGRVQFEQAKRIAAIRPGPESSAWLAQVRERIAEEYPGFDGWEATRVKEQRPSVEQKIAEIRQAVLDPVIAATDAGKGALIYLSALDAAERMVRLLPGNVRRYQQAKAARPIRDWLRSVARSVVEEHPDFARLWTGVFERELADDGF